jgi:hypothetical protein
VQPFYKALERPCGTNQPLIRVLPSALLSQSLSLFLLRQSALASLTFRNTAPHRPTTPHSFTPVNAGGYYSEFLDQLYRIQDGGRRNRTIVLASEELGAKHCVRACIASLSTIDSSMYPCLDLFNLSSHSFLLRLFPPHDHQTRSQCYL